MIHSCNNTGVNLSLLSRVMSSRLSRGTYNGGLLSTEAGTIARVIADATITVAGYMGVSKLLNITLLPSLFICIASIVATCYTYNSLYWLFLWLSGMELGEWWNAVWHNSVSLFTRALNIAFLCVLRKFNPLVPLPIPFSWSIDFFTLRLLSERKKVSEKRMKRKKTYRKWNDFIVVWYER